MIARLLVIASAAFAAYLLLAGQPRGLPPLARAGLALCALGPALALWLRPVPALGARAARGRQRLDGFDVLTLAAVVGALGTGFAWLLSAAPVPLENLGLTLEESFRPAEAAARHDRLRQQAGQRGGNWLWDQQTHRPLPKRTNLVPGTRPEAFVILRDGADAAGLLRGGVYLRAFALTNYQSASWTIQPGEPVALKADAAGLVQLASPPARRAIVHEVFHARHPAGQDVFTALQGAVAAQVPELTRLDEDFLLLPPSRQDSGYQYVASSAPLALDDLPPMPDIPPMPGAPAALTAPPPASEFAKRLRLLALVASGEGTTQQRLANIRAYLFKHYAYSLQTDNPRGLDPLENFLFEEKRGHCELFATAGALLARAIGIPARIAYGWNGGTYYEDRKMFVFRAREAHAWVEVLLASHGWVVVDTTPAGAMRHNTAAVARPGESPPVPDSDEEDETAQETTAARPPSFRAVLVALVPALGLLLWRGVRRRRTLAAAPDIRATAQDPPHYFAAWRRAAARRGWPMPPAATLRAHLARIGGGVPFGEDLLAYHYATRYGGAPRNTRTERQLRAAIRQWEAAEKPSQSAQR